ncbi:hypothetical protein [Streptomyces sp. NPDC051776]|uniref:hypothetical protein n=1 Tax=Streptomyces sp. NPDC051776 TaxID=3155414 RepID=UPI003427AE36
MEAGLVAATWSADLEDPSDVAAVAAHVRASLEAAITTARAEFEALMEPAGPEEDEEDPAFTASALAYTALKAVEQALPEYRSSALARLARTPEAEAEAELAFEAEQNRRWFRHNPTGADAIAAAAKVGPGRHAAARC